MKTIRFVATLIMLFLGVTLHAQDDAVKWTASVQPSGDDTYEITLNASIARGYHMYDLGPYNDDGPNATVITFSPEAGITLDGKMQTLTPAERHQDPTFGMEIGYFVGKATFTQRVKSSVASGKVKITMEWMSCNDTSCQPPTDKQITVNIGEPSTEAVNAVSDTTVDSTLTTTSQAAAKPDAELTSKDVVGGNGSIWALIIEAIIWGFAALLTPCVFPMVPMTVSFFMKGEGGQAKGRISAFIYGLFIVALYTLPIAAIILATRVLGGDAVTADIFNWLATHWLPNVIFFIVFMVFAASFFGAFEITLPSWIVNKSDAKADNRGLGGIFFLALTLVLVSFSCTGPIVGSVLIKSTSGEFWTPIITMLAFSIAFALPFTLCAIFPSMLKKLPKSGGWLNSVKVVLGFIEVALGMKFLSVADQVYHWGLLDREVYLAIWIVVFTLLGLYLLGKIKFAHDSDMPYLSVSRLALAIATFTFVVYMIPGMWGAPLKALSGYLPPLQSQDFVIGQMPATAAPTADDIEYSKAKYSDFLHLPHGLQGFFNLEEGEAYAAKVGKPLFIDFTGHGCVNCREMESRVWSNPEVLNILRNDYVIVALYSDDKKEVPQSDWVTTDSGTTLKTLGKINSYYALKTYGVNAQPYYVLQGRDGKILVTPRGYDLNVDNFIAYLKSGLEAFNNEPDAK